jgi:branched-chain amino acid transport system permease protein
MPMDGLTDRIHVVGRLAVPAVALVLAASLPGLITSSYYLDLLSQCCIYAILALGLNVIFGYAGQLSLGHAGFWGIGAYSSALLTVDQGWSVLPAMAVGMAISATAALVLGTVTRNLGSHYLALATLAFTGMVQLILNNTISLTQGPNGISGIPPLGLGGLQATTQTQQYYVLLGALVVVAAFCYRWQTSRYGRQAVALKRSPTAARSLGVNTATVKVVNLVISAIIASLAGTLYAHYVGFVSPDVFGFSELFKMVTMVIIGGMATTGGPIVGAALLVFAPEWFRVFSDYWQLVYAILLLVLILRMPYGIWGLVLRLAARTRNVSGRTEPDRSGSALSSATEPTELAGAPKGSQEHD